MFASRCLRVATAWLGVGRWTRTTVLHWSNPGRRRRDDDQRIKQTNHLQR